MIRNYFHRRNLTVSDKILSLDFKLFFLVLLLGIISFFAMYSTEQGKFDYYTKNHIYRFVAFFIIFIFISFINIRHLYKSAYIFYILALLLLIGVGLFGITASGSTRWINLFFINLQPSELMKIALIVFLSRYYNRIPSRDVNSIKFMIRPFFAISIPVYLVVIQPDLGTAILIASGGLAIIWLAGLRMKYFIYSFIALICIAPVVIAFLKPYQKMRILTFFNPERDPLGAG